jgi:hypothetical protein
MFFSTQPLSMLAFHGNHSFETTFSYVASVLLYTVYRITKIFVIGIAFAIVPDEPPDLKKCLTVSCPAQFQQSPIYIFVQIDTELCLY